jgi:RNA polymerase sigma-70 factor, ECF subfamily
MDDLQHWSVARRRSTTLADTPLFVERVLPHLDAAYNLARWLTRDAHDAEDVVQEACLRALRYIESLKSGDARPWFLTIVRNAFYDWIARNRPTEVVQDDGTILEAAEDPAAIDPQEGVIRSAEMRGLAEAVAALPLQFREVLVLRELEGLSYKEIASVARIPIGTVMSRLSRAREELRRILSSSLGEKTGDERRIG